MEETYPPGELDDLVKNDHQHQEPLVHHHREEHRKESDPAHQMMDNYVSTSSFSQEGMLPPTTVTPECLLGGPL